MTAQCSADHASAQRLIGNILRRLGSTQPHDNSPRRFGAIAPM